MGLFGNKPHRAVEAELINHGNHAMRWFDMAVRYKEVRPPADRGGPALDLTDRETREAIRAELVRLITTQGLAGCSEREIDGTRLAPLAQQQGRSALQNAALVSALAINSVNLIARLHREDFPRYRPLARMVDDLSRTCCAGAAQTLGGDLPAEVVETWPYFSRLFEETKRSGGSTWPDV